MQAAASKTASMKSATAITTTTTQKSTIKASSSSTSSSSSSAAATAAAALGSPSSSLAASTISATKKHTKYNNPDPKDEIEEISKKISEHADAIYRTWKCRGLAPTELLELYTNTTEAAGSLHAGAADFLMATSTARKVVVGDDDSTTTTTEGLQKLVNSFVIKDKEQRGVKNIKSSTNVKSAILKSPTITTAAANTVNSPTAGTAARSKLTQKNVHVAKQAAPTVGGAGSDGTAAVGVSTKRTTMTKPKSSAIIMKESPVQQNHDGIINKMILEKSTAIAKNDKITQQQRKQQQQQEQQHVDKTNKLHYQRKNANDVVVVDRKAAAAAPSQTVIDGGGGAGGTITKAKPTAIAKTAAIKTNPMDLNLNFDLDLNLNLDLDLDMSNLTKLQTENLLKIKELLHENAENVKASKKLHAMQANVDDGKIGNNAAKTRPRSPNAAVRPSSPTTTTTTAKVAATPTSPTAVTFTHNPLQNNKNKGKSNGAITGVGSVIQTNASVDIGDDIVGAYNINKRNTTSLSSSQAPTSSSATGTTKVVNKLIKTPTIKENTINNNNNNNNNSNSISNSVGSSDGGVFIIGAKNDNANHTVATAVTATAAAAITPVIVNVGNKIAKEKSAERKPIHQVTNTNSKSVTTDNVMDLGRSNMPAPTKIKSGRSLTNGQDKNLGRPILTRGSVAERVLMFEKCPDVRNSFLNIKRPDQIDAPPKSLLKVKLHATPPSPHDHTSLQREIRTTKSVYIPRFYFPHGKPQPTIALERTLRGILSAFDSFPNNQVTKDELPRILKLCGLPFYWRMPVMIFCQQGNSGLVERQRFVEFWKQMNVYCHDAASRFVYILSRGQRFRSYILPEDLASLVQDVVDTHPGLAFLKEATEFHSRYVHTVIARIFYSVNRSWSGKITISELKKSDLLEIITLLEEEDDINQIMAFFSYEHFYVIYCKFWELDKDHDLLINQEDLAAHSDHALSTRIVERIFSGCVTRSDNKQNPDDEPKMSYTDFVWFLLSEEDKRTPTAIEYWFRCMDIDGDGMLSMYELEYFYEEQQQRMEAIGIETLPFEDCLCQMLDMIKPQRRDCITLGDLKRCKMTHVFFDTFFNLEKYLDHEQRDPFASQRDEYSSDWDRFAAQEYELLITEEND